MVNARVLDRAVRSTYFGVAEDARDALIGNNKSLCDIKQISYMSVTSSMAYLGSEGRALTHD